MFAKRLKYLRKSRRLSQAKLAEYLGLGQQAVAKWEHGKAEPHLSKLRTLIDFFGVTADFLLGRDVNVPVFSEDEIRIVDLYRRLSVPHKNLSVQLLSALASAHNDAPPLLNQTTVKGEITGGNLTGSVINVGVLQR